MPCVCHLNDDAECPACRHKIFKAFLEAGERHKQYVEHVNAIIGQLHGTCEDCGRRYSDAAIANLLSVVLAEAPNRDFGLKMMQWALSMIHGMGIAAVPQTLKAWKELCWRKGWDDDLV